MSGLRLSFPACVIAGKTWLSAEDIILLRKYTFPEGIRSSGDVVTLLALHKTCPQKCAQWTDFFIEQLTDYIVYHCYPQGSLDDVNVAWIKAMFSTNGVVHTPLELDLILHVMAVSSFVPDSLSAFALDQLRIAVSLKTGAYHETRPNAAIGITVHDLEFILRILRGSYARGNLVLSPEEVTVLHRIDGETWPSANHPAWHEMIAAIDMRESPQRAAADRTRWLRVPDAMLLEEEMVA